MEPQEVCTEENDHDLGHNVLDESHIDEDSDGLDAYGLRFFGTNHKLGDVWLRFLQSVDMKERVTAMSEFTELFSEMFDTTNRASRRDIIGHPPSVVLEICNQLLTYIDIHRNGKVDAAKVWLETVCGSALKWNTTDVHVKVVLCPKLFVVVDHPSGYVGEDQSICQNRKHFLLLCRCLAVMLGYEHNQLSICNMYNEYFFQCLVEIIRSLVERLEILSVLWSECCSPKTVGQTSPAPQLLSDSDFSLTALVAGIQVCSRLNSHTIYAAINESFNWNGYMANQPWEPKYLRSIAACCYPFEKNSVCPELGDISCHQSFPSRQQAFNKLIRYSCQEYDAASEGSSSNMRGILCRLGTMETFVLLLRKLAHLSNILNQFILASPKIRDIDLVLYIWRSVVAAQCELLFGMLVAITQDPVGNGFSFFRSGGETDLQSVLSMLDAVNLSETSDANPLVSENGMMMVSCQVSQRLVFCRSLACLRLPEVMESSLQYLRRLESFKAFPECQTICSFSQSLVGNVLRSLKHFIEWLYSSFGVDNLENNTFSEFTKMKLCCEFPLEVFIQPYSCDLVGFRGCREADNSESVDGIGFWESPRSVSAALRSKFVLDSPFTLATQFFGEMEQSLRNQGVNSAVNTFVCLRNALLPGCVGSEDPDEMQCRTEGSDINWLVDTLRCCEFNLFFVGLFRLINSPPQMCGDPVHKFVWKNCFAGLVESSFSLHPSQHILPRLQFYVLFFLSACLEIQPIAVRTEMLNSEMRNLLIQSPMFLKNRETLRSYPSQLVVQERISKSFDIDCGDLESDYYHSFVQGISAFSHRIEETTNANEDSMLIQRSENWMRLSILHSPSEPHVAGGNNAQQECVSSGMDSSQVVNRSPLPHSLANFNAAVSIFGVFVRDCVLLLLWSVLSLNGQHTDMSGSFALEEAPELLQVLTHESSDDMLLQVVRWLNMLVQTDCAQLLHPSLWNAVLAACLNLSRMQVSIISAPPSLASEGSETANTLHSERPFLSPARMAVLQLIFAICTSKAIADDSWINVFLPSSNAVPSLAAETVCSPEQSFATPSKSRAGETNQLMKHQKHAILLRLIMDIKCSDVALFLLTRIFSVCASVVSESRNRDSIVLFPLSPVKPGNGSVKRDVTVYEALVHDILRGLLSVIRASSNQQNILIGYNASMKCVSFMTAYFRMAPEDTGLGELVGSYGACHSAHRLFHWNSHKPPIWRELFAATEAALLHPNADSFTSRMRSHMLRSILKLMTAFMSRNEENRFKFYKCMMERNRKNIEIKIPSSDDVDGQSTGVTQSIVCYAYMDVVQMFLRMEPDIELETIHVLLEMMFDCSFDIVVKGLTLDSNLETSYLRKSFIPIRSGAGSFTSLIENISLVPILIELAVHSRCSYQEAIFATLLHIVRDSPCCRANISRIKQLHTPVVDILLDAYGRLSSSISQSYALNLIQSVGKYSINMRQLKKLFRVVNESKKRSSEHWKRNVFAFVDCLCGMMASQREEPRRYFQFSGQDSGLQLPDLMWKANRGFSFSCWFKVHLDSDQVGGTDAVKDSPYSQSSRKLSNLSRRGSSGTSQENVLLSLRQKNGNGIEVTIMHHQSSSQFTLQINVFAEKKTFTVLTADISEAILGKDKAGDSSWHHIAISQSVAFFRVPSELTVLFDNKLHKPVVTLPKFLNPTEPVSGMIGDRVSQFRDNRYLGAVSSAFRGDTGTIYFFSDWLSETSLRRMFSLGPIDNDEIRKEGPLFSSITLLINPSLSHGDYIVDSSPDDNAAKWTGFSCDGMQIKRNPGTSINHICYINDELDGLGGIKTLLPFLQDACASRYAGSNTAVGICDALLCIKIMDLLMALIKNTTSVESIKLIDGTGFAIIAHHLEYIDAAYLTSKLLDCCLGHIQTLSSADWRENAMKHLICNMRIWNRVAASTAHIKLWDAICQYALANVDAAARIMPVQTLLDHLKRVYSLADEKGEASSMSNAKESGIDGLQILQFDLDSELPMDWLEMEDHNNDSTELSAGSELAKIDILIIRSFLWRIIEAQVKRSMSMLPTASIESLDDDDVQVACTDNIYAIVRFIVVDPHEAHKLEGIKSLTLLFNSPELLEVANQSTLANLVDQPFITALTVLVTSNQSLRVQLYAFVGICCMLRLCLYVKSVGMAASDDGDSGRCSVSTPTEIDSGPPLSARSSQGVAAAKVSPRFPLFAAAQASARSRLSKRRKSFVNLAQKFLSSPQKLPDALSHDAQPNEKYLYFGLAETSFAAVISWIEQLIIKQIRAELSKSSLSPPQHSQDVADSQLQVVFDSLQRAMYGEDSSYLLEEIDKIFILGKDMPVELSSAECSSKFIHLPRLLPSVFYVVESTLQSSKRKLYFSHQLFSRLTQTENKISVLSVPGWQKGFLSVFVMEHQICGQWEAKQSEMDRLQSETICELLLDLFGEFHKCALKCGVPNVESFMIPKCLKQGGDKDSAPKAKDVVEDILARKRKPGVAVIRETLAHFRVLAQQGQVDMMESGYGIICKALTHLKAESETLFTATKPNLKDTVDWPKKYHVLNILQMTKLVMEFLTIPCIQPVNKFRSVSRDLIVNDDPSPDASMSFTQDTNKERPRVGSRQSFRLSVSDIRDQLLDDVFLLFSHVDCFGSMMFASAEHSSRNDKFGFGRKRNSDLVEFFDEKDIPCVPLSSSSSSSSSGSIGNVQVYLRSTSSIIGSFIRLIGDHFVEGAQFQVHLEVPPTENRVVPIPKRQKEALNKLRYLKTRGAEFFQTEVHYLTSKIVEALRSCSGLWKLNGWAHEAIEFLLELLVDFRVEIVKQLLLGTTELMKHTENTDADASVSRNMGTTTADLNLLPSSPRLARRPSSARGGEESREVGWSKELAGLKLSMNAELFASVTPSKESLRAQYILPLLNPQQLSHRALQRQPSTASSGSDVGTFVLELVQNCLFSQLRGTETSLRLLSWRIWDAGFDSVLRRVRELDVRTTTTHVNDLGFDKHAEQVAEAEDNMRILENSWTGSFNGAVITHSRSTKAAESKRLSEQRCIEMQQKKNIRLEWSFIWKEMSNERGPWGSGVLVSQTNASVGCAWKLHMSESLLRSHPLLLRTTRKQLKTPLERRSNDSSAADANEPTVTNVTVEDVSMSGLSGNDSSMSSMLRDVLRFTRRKSISENESFDDDIDDVLSTSEEENNAANNGKLLFGTGCRLITRSCNSTNPPQEGYLSITSRTVTFSTSRQGDGSSNFASVPTDRQSFVERDSFQLGSIAAGLIQTFVSTPISTPRLLSTPSSYFGMDSSTPTTTQGTELPQVTMEWKTEELRDLLRRRYNLRNTAIEMFFMNRVSVLLDFDDSHDTDRIEICLRHRVLAPHLLFVERGHSRPDKLIVYRCLEGSGGLTLTEAWCKRKISNFTYLMHLNLIAGRSYNDLGQYPIFPWVLADYSSSYLNLQDPKTFRDLRWPIGAQTREQRQVASARYAQLLDFYNCSQMDQEVTGGSFDSKDGSFENNQRNTATCPPPFHFGSHYSVAGFVIWYLLRLEPFTTFHLQLQGGKFDKADRLFGSLRDTYHGCTTSSADVKELIPELFYLPEALLNVNRHEMGSTQSGRRVDNVDLPLWTKGSAHEFIRLHRKALESEHVSANLHHWIDLIFGYKQRPAHLGGSQEAVDSCNVFYHLTYEGSVDLEALRRTDEDLYQQCVCQISEFGQTPFQLFNKPHPSRELLYKVPSISRTSNNTENSPNSSVTNGIPLEHKEHIVEWPFASIVLGIDTIPFGCHRPAMPTRILCREAYKPHNLPLIAFILLPGNKLFTVDSSRILRRHELLVNPPDMKPAYVLKLDKAVDVTSRKSQWSLMRGNETECKRIGVPFAKHSLPSTGKDDVAQEWKPTGILEYRSIESTAQSDNVMDQRFHFARSSTNTSATSAGSGDGDARGGESQQLVVPRHRSRTQRKFSDASKSSSSARSPRERSGSETNINKCNVKARSRAQSNVSDEHLSDHLFACLPSQGILFSGGHWDNSLRITSLDPPYSNIQTVNSHRDCVTCLAISSYFGRSYLASGSKDCTVMIWIVNPRTVSTISTMATGGAPASPILSSHPLHILYGHDAAIICVAVNAEFDIVISGSDDGTLIVHSLQQGEYIRSIVLKASLTNAWVGGYTEDIDSPTPADQSNDLASVFSQATNDDTSGSAVGCKVSWVGISIQGYIVVYCCEHYFIRTYSLNGDLLAWTAVDERLHSLKLSHDGNVLLTGGDHCLVVMRWVHSLKLADDGPRKGFQCIFDGATANPRVPFLSPIRSLMLTEEERLLLVGLESGEMRFLSNDSDYLQPKVTDLLFNAGIL